MYPSLSEALGEEITPQTPAERLWEIADRLGVEIPRDRGYGHGKLVEELWEHTVGNKLWAPTFVSDFPVETTPLTRAHRSIAGVTEKWDLYIRRIELATGYSELIDPVIQRERFERRPALRRRATTRQWRSMRIFSLPWSMRCRRRLAPEWVSIGC